MMKRGKGLEDNRHLIASVTGAAADAGIRAGDVLVSIGGETVHDLIDYLALSDAKRVELCVIGRGSKRCDVAVSKLEGEPLGLMFDRPLMSSRRMCANKCPFCFVDQLPQSARASLREKDDDWRESLMMGNYVTLTNVSDKEFSRILKRRVQPLYISVHAAEPELRARMMGNDRAKGLWGRLAALGEAKLAFHAQIVLCPGLNDGEALSHTLSELSKLSSLQSVAVVPVGLSAHREGLYELKPVDKPLALDAIERIEKYKGLAFAADELYLLAEKPLPPYEYYGGFLQVEDGVGMLRLFEDEFKQSVTALRTPPAATIVTGESAAGFLRALLGGVEELKGVEVIAAPNLFFGGHVSVAGLVTGGDIAAAMKGLYAKRLLIPASMLKDGEVFLDDMTLPELERKLKTNIEVVAVSGAALWEALTA